MEKIPSFLRDLGLSEKETQIYLFLARKGPKIASDLSLFLEINRVQIYRFLKNLQSKGIVECTFEYPASYVAVPFRKLLDLQINRKKEEARSLEDNREELVSQFDLQEPEVSEPFTDRFMVLDGRANVYSRIGQMIQESKNTLAVVTSNYGMIQAYHAGLFNYGFSHPSKDVVLFRLLTSLSTVDNIELTKELLDEAEKNSLCFQYHIGDFGAGYFPRFIIKDENELLFFLKMTEDNSSVIQKDTGLWTNNQVLVHAFIAFFEKMWSESKDIFDLLARVKRRTPKYQDEG